MCLAIVSFRELAEWPLFVAANRDEEYARPSAPPCLEEAEGVRWLAPLDQRAGGTWIGVTERRLFALITNRSDLAGAPSAGASSRGLLVRELLAAGTLEAALERGAAWGAAPPRAPFNLVLGSPAALYLIEHRGEGAPRLRELGPGATVLSNRGAANDRNVPEVRRGAGEWRRARAAIGAGAAAPWSAAAEILGRTEASPAGPPLSRRGEERGTVSSTLLGIGSGGEIRFLYADGPPPETPYCAYSFPEKRAP